MDREEHREIDQGERIDDTRVTEGKGENYFNYTRSELFDLIERTRQRCEYYKELDRKNELRRKGIKTK